MKRYLIIDGNSLAHAANNGPKLTVGTTEVQAIFGMIRSIHKLMQVYSMMTPLVLWDGASWRKMKFPDYKANRDKADSKHEQMALAAKQGLKKQSPAIVKALTLLGIDQIRAANMEADDLAAILVDRYVARGDKIMLVSGDRDWLQLVGPNVTWFNPIAHNGETGPDRVGPNNFEEKTGVATTKQFVEMKALTGDMSDNVPGVGKIGDKGAIEFLSTYGSFADFLNMWTFEKSIGDAEFKRLPKKFRDLIEDEAKAVTFQRNIELMDLRTSVRPEPINLTVTRGTPDREKFRALCEKLAFKSIYSNFDNWIEVFPVFYQQEQAA